MGVLQRLEHERDGRLLGVHRPRRRLLGSEVGAGDVAAVGGRRKLLRDHVEERVAADGLRGARAEHGHDRAGADAALERLEHRGLVERALLEVLGEGALDEASMLKSFSRHSWARSTRSAGMSVSDDLPSA